MTNKIQKTFNKNDYIVDVSVFVYYNNSAVAQTKIQVLPVIGENTGRKGI
jgi:hypothetical protein